MRKPHERQGFRSHDHNLPRDEVSIGFDRLRRFSLLDCHQNSHRGRGFASWVASPRECCAETTQVHRWRRVRPRILSAGLNCRRVPGVAGLLLVSGREAPASPTKSAQA
jgi:hypothetical protein